MKQSKQLLLRQRFNMFNHVLGENLEMQLQRFITLTSEMRSAGIMLPRSEINKKLLTSLPRSWDMNVSVIKKTKDLNKMLLAETMAVIKACDVDDKQREINHVNSYSAANVGASTNSAFSAQPTMIAPSSSCASMAPSSSSSSSSSTQTPHAPAMAKGVEENLGLRVGLINCYNALVAGELAPPVMMGELDQIHPDDVEEMDISWHKAMAVFRAKKFTQRTGKNNCGRSPWRQEDGLQQKQD